MAPVDNGNLGPTRKATGFMTNDEYIAEAVDRRCFGGHDHIQLLNGRAKVCEKYLPRLVAALCDSARFATEHASRGMRGSASADGTRSTADNRSTGSWTSVWNVASYGEGDLSGATW